MNKITADTPAPQSTHEVEYKRTLTRLDLFGIAIGMIIGAGVMTLTGIAIAKTGRSVCISYLIATVFVIFFSIPTIFSSSVARFKGGSYSTFAIFVGEKWSGAWIIVYILGELSLSMYALSFAEYFQAIVPTANPRVVAVVLATVFFGINFFGTSIMAKFENIMTISLLGALLLFIVCGMPQVQWDTFFTQPGFVTHGWLGVIAGGAFLNYALMGATPLLQFSAECKNPKRDIPFVIVVSTLSLAVLFAFVSVVASGVLPVEMVAGKPLTLVCEVIFSRPLFLFFIVAGALCATATTLNANIGYVTKPLVQAARDGWLPAGLAKLHPKYRTPYRLLAIYYLITILPIMLNFSIKQIADLVMFIIFIRSGITALGFMRLPKIFPTQWEKSLYHIPNKYYSILLFVCAMVSFFQLAANVISGDFKILLINLVVLVCAIIYSLTRWKSGKVHMEINWEEN